jgi:hypothetical protein
VSLDVAALFDKDQVDLSSFASTISTAPQIAQGIPTRLGSNTSRRTGPDEPSPSALRLEKMAISLTIGLIVMVAASTSSPADPALWKNRDIAILKTIRREREKRDQIFMMETHHRYRRTTVGAG